MKKTTNKKQKQKQKGDDEGSGDGVGGSLAHKGTVRFGMKTVLLRRLPGWSARSSTLAMVLVLASCGQAGDKKGLWMAPGNSHGNKGTHS